MNEDNSDDDGGVNTVRVACLSAAAGVVLDETYPSPIVDHGMARHPGSIRGLGGARELHRHGVDRLVDQRRLASRPT